MPTCQLLVTNKHTDICIFKMYAYSRCMHIQDVCIFHSIVTKVGTHVEILHKKHFMEVDRGVGGHIFMQICCA